MLDVVEKRRIVMSVTDVGPPPRLWTPHRRSSAQRVTQERQEELPLTRRWDLPSASRDEGANGAPSATVRDSTRAGPRGQTWGLAAGTERATLASSGPEEPMTQYDANVIYEFADRLYAQARSIMVFYTLLGGLIGGVGGYLLDKEFRTGLLALGGLVVLGGIGFAIGRERGFVLRLQAQTALCQVQIEQNTRGAPAELRVVQ